MLSSLRQIYRHIVQQIYRHIVQQIYRHIVQQIVRQHLIRRGPPTGIREWSGIAVLVSAAVTCGVLAQASLG